MSDLFGEALGEFHADEASVAIVPLGAAAVRATVTHRRKVKTMTLSVVGVLLVALPIAAFAAGPRGNPPPVPPAESGSPSPQQSPEPSPEQTRPSAAPDARFTIEQLVAARVQVPQKKWLDCPKTVGAKPSGHKEKAVYVAKVVYTDLDEDPALETAAWVWCNLYEGFISQVVGYDAGPGGAPVSLGAVVPSLAPHGIEGLDARAAGGVTVDVAFDTYFHDLGNPDPQRRAFAWNGTAFVQVGGPASFPGVQKTDLAVTVSGPLNLGPSSGGKRVGSLTLTVRNNGPNPTQLVRLSFGIGTGPLAGVRIVGQGDRTVLTKPALAAGKSHTFTVQIEVPDSVTASHFTISAHSYISDTDGSNQSADIPVSRR